MNKTIEELTKILCDAYPCGVNCDDCILREYAEKVYNAGYRKTFTSEFATETQKAYKEGFAIAQLELEAQEKIIKAQQKQIQGLKKLLKAQRYTKDEKQEK